ncbi:hypothetical protein [Mucilaginibacter jinjuensis]|uniref:Uncharacterized protein n=1 Tax=Mucilaginibacter jinjuensis TaxID=1176721 RepID=A0ABY7T7B2_9SPHI|nr:hypothetical protein [Mucilaginibacter jinjuensis]WCT11577.1 hypothetical protein PQO05_22820 [Mucilaginibacter jinjuensis]
MKKVYYLEVDKKRIGHTEFEYADPPMGVVYGKILFNGIKFPYDFLKDHCVKYNVQINSDDPNHRFIDTVIIPRLKVFLPSGEELMGWGGAINGTEADGFEIQFSGISSEIMQNEFVHHYLKYYGQ